MGLKHVIFLVLLCAHTWLFAQKLSYSAIVYFDNAKSELKQHGTSTLDSILLLTKSCQSFYIVVEGHTDNVGDSLYNMNLSANRVDAVKQYLIQKGLNAAQFKDAHFGESKPLRSNDALNSRALNRRVEVEVYCTKSSPKPKPDVVNVKEEIAQPTVYSPPPRKANNAIDSLFKSLRQNCIYSACIFNDRDTTLLTSSGDVIYIPAGAFVLTKKESQTCVTIEFTKAFTVADMVRNRLSTEMADGTILESGGMARLQAFKSNGQPASFNKAKSIIWVSAEQEPMPNTPLLYQGSANPEIGWVGWNALSASNPPGTTFHNASMVRCPSFFTGGSNLNRCDPCKFFFCRIFRLDNVVAGWFDVDVRRENLQFRYCQRRLKNRDVTRLEKRQRRLLERNPQQLVNIPALPIAGLSTELMYKSCYELENLLAAYGVSDANSLLMAMNKPLLDSFKVNNLVDLRKAMKKAEIELIEKQLAGEAPEKELLGRYITKLRQPAWYNIDILAKFGSNGRTVIKLINHAYDVNNATAFLLFPNRKIVLGFSSYDLASGAYMISNVPQDEEVKIVAFKMAGKDIAYGTKTLRASKKTSEVSLEYELINLKELNDRVEQLNDL